MNVMFSHQAWEDYKLWKERDKKLCRKIDTLLTDIERNQHSGLGKPEPLRHQWSGWWSRRIDEEHRMIYRIVADTIEVALLRSHYGDH